MDPGKFALVVTKVSMTVISVQRGDYVSVAAGN